MKDDVLFLTCTDKHARVVVLNNQLKTILSQPVNSGGYSTPLAMDLDQNQQLDIVIPRFHYINRFEITDQPINYSPGWNQYRGRLWNGVYSN